MKREYFLVILSAFILFYYLVKQPTSIVEPVALIRVPTQPSAVVSKKINHEMKVKKQLEFALSNKHPNDKLKAEVEKVIWGIKIVHKRMESEPRVEDSKINKALSRLQKQNIGIEVQTLIQQTGERGLVNDQDLKKLIKACHNKRTCLEQSVEALYDMDQFLTAKQFALLEKHL